MFFRDPATVQARLWGSLYTHPHLSVRHMWIRLLSSTDFIHQLQTQAKVIHNRPNFSWTH